jgi:hypothetical protein
MYLGVYAVGVLGGFNIYIHTYIYLHKHVTYTYTYTSIHIFIYIHTHIHIHIRIYLGVTEVSEQSAYGPHCLQCGGALHSHLQG